MGASIEELKAAYRKVAQTYHPDKVASLAPEFQALAEQKMKEINRAYGLIMKEFEKQFRTEF
jgi:DnaJ-class molecular chaperone